MSVPTLLHQAWAAQTRRNGLAWKTDRGQRAGQRCIGVPWELVRTVCVRGRSYRQWVSRQRHPGPTALDSRAGGSEKEESAPRYCPSTRKGEGKTRKGSRSCLVVLVENRRMPPGRACE